MLGIVILNYIEYIQTFNCVSSIRKTINVEYIIYIIDNNSPNESLSMLNDKYKDDDDIVVIENIENKGYAAGNNVGVKRAIKDNCSSILISNSDVIYADGAIDNMVQFLINNRDAGVVGPVVCDSNGNFDIKSRIFTRTGIKEKLFARTFLRSLNYKNIYRDYYGLDKSIDETQEIYTLMGCCFLMSIDLVKLITPFDENTFLYEEEVIFGESIHKSDFKAFAIPNAKIWHMHKASTKHIGAYQLIHLVNSEIYFCKTYLNEKLYRILLIYIMRVGLYIRFSLNDKDYRRKFFVFLSSTIKRLSSKDGL